MQYQELRLFPSLFPALSTVGTWEQSSGSSLVVGRSSALRNKIRAGYADLQRAAGDARRKFRAPIAAGAAVQALELGRIQRAEPNGGNPPFLTARSGHVGTAMLEGSRQASANARVSDARPKLGRLRDLGLAELAADCPGEGPGAPNRARLVPGMPALHAGGIWIELRSGASIGAVQAGSSHDWSHRTVGLDAQTDTRRRGPGGARFSDGSKGAVGARNRGSGKRAGVNRIPAVARLHDAGEFSKLRRDFAAVNGGC